MADTKIVISVRDVNKTYDGVEVLKNINLDVYKGEIFGFIGPNGAGKTTLMKILCAIEKPRSGEVVIEGYSVCKEETKTKAFIGYLPETSSLYEDMTVNDYLLFFSELYSIEKATANRRINKLLCDIKLQNKMHSIIGSLSNGMKRKVAIVRAMLNEPEILIFDEPTANLDVMTAHFIRKFMRELAKKGKTILFASHDLYEVQSVCDRIAVMYSGEVKRVGVPGELVGNHKLTLDFMDAGGKKKSISVDVGGVQKMLDNLNGKLLGIRGPDLEEEFEKMIKGE